MIDKRDISFVKFTKINFNFLYVKSHYVRYVAFDLVRTKVYMSVSCCLNHVIVSVGFLPCQRVTITSVGFLNTSHANEAIWDEDEATGVLSRFSGELFDG